MTEIKILSNYLDDIINNTTNVYHNAFVTNSTIEDYNIDPSDYHSLAFSSMLLSSSSFWRELMFKHKEDTHISFYLFKKLKINVTDTNLLYFIKIINRSITIYFYILRFNDINTANRLTTVSATDLSRYKYYNLSSQKHWDDINSLNHFLFEQVRADQLWSRIQANIIYANNIWGYIIYNDKDRIIAYMVFQLNPELQTVYIYFLVGNTQLNYRKLLLDELTTKSAQHHTITLQLLHYDKNSNLSFYKQYGFDEVTLTFDKSKSRAIPLNFLDTSKSLFIQDPTCFAQDMMLNCLIRKYLSSHEQSKQQQKGAVLTGTFVNISLMNHVRNNDEQVIEITNIVFPYNVEAFRDRTQTSKIFINIFNVFMTFMRQFNHWRYLVVNSSINKDLEIYKGYLFSSGIEFDTKYQDIEKQVSWYKVFSEPEELSVTSSMDTDDIQKEQKTERIILEPYQMRAAEILKTENGHILYDSTGSGKTLAAIYTGQWFLNDFNKTKPRKVLMISSISLINGYRIEQTKYEVSEEDKSNTIIIEITQLQKHFVDILRSSMKLKAKLNQIYNVLKEMYQWDKYDWMMEVDEIHNFRNPKTIPGRLLRYIGSFCKKRLGLSATPCVNIVGDLCNEIAIVAGEVNCVSPEQMTKWCARLDLYGNLIKALVKNYISSAKINKDTSDYPTINNRVVILEMSQVEYERYKLLELSAIQRTELQTTKRKRKIEDGDMEGDAVKDDDDNDASIVKKGSNAFYAQLRLMINTSGDGGKGGTIKLSDSEKAIVGDYTKLTSSAKVKYIITDMEKKQLSMLSPVVL
jgi:hypothetical protein